MSTDKVWVGSGLVDAAVPQISVFDHGFTVGDGVFEAVKAVGGRPFAMTRHLARLARSADGLGLPPVDVDAVRHAVTETLLANDVPPLARIRITYSAGISPLGSERGTHGPTLVVAVGASKAHAETTAIATVPWPRNERGALAGIKTTSYAENAKALAHAQSAGATEAVFADTTGRLSEGTGSNIFVVRDGRILTPPLATGCLAGVTRALVLKWVPGAEEADLPFETLLDADEIFLTSTLRDVQGVHRADGRELAAPGPITKGAMAVFAERSAEDHDPQ
ncbi:aminotransferase class IV [Catenulispora acidiphila DSM 44928]|uniref:aminodeoxychorismate lyase n=1 Tax=Catenulispora acidiphila (strain DSM 44928 / JCM 14897 / NBRC 102108 / NRRL B-24433 / ID139908) TaxID=479433 RepID=C7QHW2_CATAD|nr:aminodeoxychorismate lyase [Catenulispora acidiphila]ACU71137.1 aminotransferase class IV [Catenulispora acidiphila DSM 44928]